MIIKKEKVNPNAVLKKHRESLMETISGDLESKGVVMFRPQEDGGHLNIASDYLNMPLDITETPSQLLGQHLNAFTQQKMYMRTLIGWQLIFLEEAKRKYYSVSDPVYKQLSGQKLSETAKERVLNNDPRIQPAFFEYKDCKRKLDLLELNILSIEDAIFQISREISRRTGDFNTETRNHNVSRR